MKNLNLYALANELNLGDPKSGTIRVPFGRWDFGAKKLDDGRTVFFVQELTRDGAERMAAKINAGVADGEKGVPVYWGHPDVPELAHKYPDKRAKGWIKSAAVEADALILNVEWLEENATDGFGWFSPYWGGPATDLGQGRYLKHLDSLTSVALINIPNIQEFRLANELQGGIRGCAIMLTALQIELASRFDAAHRAALANESGECRSPDPAHCRVHGTPQKSALVKYLLAARPRTVSPLDCDMALREGFEVDTAFSTRVKFGDKLAEHIRHHNPADQRRRKIHLLYAIATVRGGRRMPNPQGGSGSFAYERSFDGLKIRVLTDANGNVEDVFDIIPPGRRGR